MAYPTRNQVLNCRVTEETLSLIDSWRLSRYNLSRADVVELLVRILNEDIEHQTIRDLLWNRIIISPGRDTMRLHVDSVPRV